MSHEASQTRVPALRFNTGSHEVNVEARFKVVWDHLPNSSEHPLGVQNLSQLCVAPYFVKH